MIVISLTLLILFMAVAALVASIVILKKVRRKTAAKENLAIAGVVISSILVVLAAGVAIFLFAFSQTWGEAWRGNQAERDIRPILTKIEQLGAKEICHSDNNGYEISNRTPSYKAYYTVATAPADLTAKIKAITQSHGFDLQEDTDYITYLKEPTTVENNIGLNSVKETFNPATDYLAAMNSGDLSVFVHRNTTVSVSCPNANVFERPESTGTGAIIQISLSLPEVER